MNIQDLVIGKMYRHHGGTLVYITKIVGDRIEVKSTCGLAIWKTTADKILEEVK